MTLSILLTGIRNRNWDKLYHSIKNAYSGDFEFIIVGPEPLSKDLSFKKEITFIQDYGSPTRCQQIALCHASGEYVTWAVDDGFYCPHVLDKMMLEMTPEKVFCIKYTEGNSGLIQMQKDEFYYLRYHHQALRPYTPHHYKLLNFGMMSTELLKSSGGWDTKFESLALSELDLAIRLQMLDIQVDIFQGIALICSWLPGIEGDHAPMHYATLEDQVLYNKIYSQESCWDRLKIELENWKESPNVWTKRFGEMQDLSEEEPKLHY